MNNKQSILKILFVPLLLFAANTVFPGEKVTRLKNGILIERDSVKIKIEIVSPEIIHVVASLGDFGKQKSLIVDESIETREPREVIEYEDGLKISTDSLLINYSSETGDLLFYKNGELIMRECGRYFSYGDSALACDAKIRQAFRITSEEAIYGLGQHQNGILNYRNKAVRLVQDNSEIAVPFVLSTNNYGILWDNYSETNFSDSPGGMSFQSDAACEISYYFIYSADFDGIISGYRYLTGSVPLFPKWSYGYFQSRNRYWTQNELIGTVAKFRERSIPIDVIVLDYLHWGKYGFGSFRFDESFFPDPKRMIDSLHNIYNCKLMVSVWPSFTKGIPNWQKMSEGGFLLNVNSYENTQVYDAYNPGAGKLYWELMDESYGKLGIDGWWLDATEPERVPEYRLSNNYLGKSAQYLNTFSLADVRNVYEGQRNSDTDKRVFILTRSAFAGQQKYAASSWSGDIGTTFDVLKKQISAGLNFCMSGIPYWNTDIGGYKGGDPSDDAYRELYIRWFQYGTFCPIFRSHGRRAPGDRKTPNEIWSYGEKAETVLKKYLDLRYRLLPYIYSEAWKITNSSGTIMRALPFDFKNDAEVFDISDQFMFGNSILVNPIVEQGAVSRTVYLPSGSGWIDFWTGKKYEGGKSINADAGIDKIPLFVKAGSIIPFGPFLHYSTEKVPDPVELRLYPGANAEFVLFEDENDGYNYEKEIYSTIKFSWNDSDRTLLISKRKGEFQGMMKERTFDVIIVGENHGGGIQIEKNIDKKIHYTGAELVTRF